MGRKKGEEKEEKNEEEKGGGKGVGGGERFPSAKFPLLHSFPNGSLPLPPPPCFPH